MTALDLDACEILRDNDAGGDEFIGLGLSI